MDRHQSAASARIPNGQKRFHSFFLRKCSQNEKLSMTGMEEEISNNPVVSFTSSLITYNWEKLVLKVKKTQNL
jgi:hypothetical protein